MTNCIYCDANPANDARVVLFRCNTIGQTPAQWICKDCCGLYLELHPYTNRPHFLHSHDCPGYCDYACNDPEGFECAESLDKSMPQ